MRGRIGEKEDCEEDEREGWKRERKKRREMRKIKGKGK